MAVDTALIRAYTNGLVATTEPGDTSVVLPTNASTPLSADFIEIGAISEDGVAEAMSQDVTDVFMWQNGALARRIKGQSTKTFTFAAIETSLITLGVHFSGSVITQTAEGVTVEEAPPGTDVRPWVIHGIDGGKAVRIVVPRGEITERGDLPMSSQGLTVYEWTLSAYVDTNGKWAYRYYLDDALASGS